MFDSLLWACYTTIMIKQKAVISLFDLTGVMVEPWVEGGYQCFIFDMQHPDVSIEEQLEQEANPIQVTGLSDEWYEPLHEIFNHYDVQILFSFPPCTDLAVSGAAHFARKYEADHLYRDKAMQLVYMAYGLANAYDVPVMIENPVSVISTEWRKPDYSFHPYEYGGYLPVDDESPYELIPNRDCYTKKTCLWTSGNFVMPEAMPVALPSSYTYSPQHLKLGGKSLKTKNIRSATPRGFARAVYTANSDTWEVPKMSVIEWPIKESDL